MPDDQLSLAIGKEGQNARLAARLTGYKIDIKSAKDAAEGPSKKEKDAELPEEGETVELPEEGETMELPEEPVEIPEMEEASGESVETEEASEEATETEEAFEEPADEE